MRYLIIAVLMLLGQAGSASAEISVGIGIGLPGINIGINVPAYPQLVPVPGYPVYYDPRANSNYFFYDGLYWVFQDDNWYASSWYNGPWQSVGPEEVPLFVLRIPVRYYRQPPVYFRGWRTDAPPRWGEHWGRDWEEHRSGWDRWDRRSVPRAAPLPAYQRQYSGDRYPRAEEQQHAIRSEHYRYQPHETVTERHFQQRDNPDDSRVAPQQRAPIEQRSSPRQQHSSPQRQQAQPMQPQGRQEQGRQSESRGSDEKDSTAQQGKRRDHESGPQDKDRDNRGDERGQDRR